MRLEYIGLSELSGSLIALRGVKDVAFDEMAEITLENGERRYGRVILIDGDRVVLQVFEGTRGISLENASTHFVGKSMDIALSREMLGRVFDGAGRPIDGLGEIYPGETVYRWEGKAVCPDCFKWAVRALLETSPGRLADELGVERQVLD